MTVAREAQEAAQRSQYLSFRLSGGDYAVGILQVKEILQYETVTPVPSVPASIRGVINLRGAVVPVIDLSVKFGLPPTPVTKRTCIVIVEVAFGGEGTILGFVADAVREVLELGSQDVGPPPSFGTQVRAEHLLGMGKVGKGFVLLLDLDRVVSAADLDSVARFPADLAGERAADAPATGDAEPPGGSGAATTASSSGAGRPSSASWACPPTDRETPGAAATSSPEVPAADGAVAKEIEQAIRAHLQWKVRIRSAIACGKFDLPVRTIRADDACAFGRWLHRSALPDGVRGTERLALVKKLHKSFHQATANVVELALAGRKTEAQRAIAEDGAFTVASQSLLEALRAWR